MYADVTFSQVVQCLLVSGDDTNSWQETGRARAVPLSIPVVPLLAQRSVLPHGAM